MRGRERMEYSYKEKDKRKTGGVLIHGFCIKLVHLTTCNYNNKLILND